MGKANRRTLKNYFKSGSMPSQKHFAELIDSMLNMVDEGFDKSVKDGFKISQLGQSSALISFYHHSDLNKPLWSLTCDKDKGQLVVKSDRGEPVLVLCADRRNDSDPLEHRVGIGCKVPRFPLDVAGVAAVEGRTGGIRGCVPADGGWHPIVENLEGCQALEVMAGVGLAKTGRYALLRATALNVYNPRGFLMNFLNRKKRIRCQHVYFRSRCDRIMLSWQPDGKGYALALKTKSKYPDDALVQYNVTRLWFDETMAGSQSHLRSTAAPAGLSE